MKRIFVSHPCGDSPQLDFLRADRICRQLLSRGVLPVSPLHLFSFAPGVRRGERLDMRLRLIDLCDELNVYGDSPETRAEVRYAWKRGMVVNDCTVRDWDRFLRERSEVAVRG